MGRGRSSTFLAGKFCRCVKKVAKTVKLRKGSTRGSQGSRGSRDSRGKESAAIAICVKSVLGSRGRTLRKVRCTTRPKRLETQSPSNVKSSK
jgi:hypothetical protein